VGFLSSHLQLPTSVTHNNYSLIARGGFVSYDEFQGAASVSSISGKLNAFSKASSPPPLPELPNTNNINNIALGPSYGLNEQVQAAPIILPPNKSFK
jgi:hypothetical protein